MNPNRLTIFALLHVFLFAGCISSPPARDPLAGWKWLGGYHPSIAESIKRLEGKKNALGNPIVTTPKEYEKYAKECPFDKAIVNDYESYIRKEKLDLDFIEFFEDGTGQHAVRIHGFKSGFFVDATSSMHILIYDKSNVRKKPSKWITGRYLC
jgi:hypothetical protein